jgi:hypothetical protein
MKLEARVNSDLVLDLGRTDERVIHPPGTSLFHQVLSYLEAMPDPTGPRRGSEIGREGLAATAISLRWGSYLALLLQDAPVCAAVKSPEVSRISDSEMARINIEASAALSEWIDISRADRGHYMRLVNRAVAYLPMPQRTSKRANRSSDAVRVFEALSIQCVAEDFLAKQDPGRLAQARIKCAQHPSRVLANAFINAAWRNGPIESIHAGIHRPAPIDQRRITRAEERQLMKHTSTLLALGMDCVWGLQTIDESGRPWSEQVLPYALAEQYLITPARWTTTESSRDVHLYGAALEI